MKKLQLLSVAAILVITASCKKETKQCNNGLNVNYNESCKCATDEYLIATSEGITSNGEEIGYNKCAKPKAEEWIMTIHDESFAHPSFLYRVLPAEKYELLGGKIEDPYSMLAVGSTNGFKAAGCWYLGEKRDDGSLSVILDFRPMENMFSVDAATGEGFFITGQIIDGIPQNFKLNRGSSADWHNYEISSSSPITLSK